MELQRVALVNNEIFRREIVSKFCHDVTIDFDDMERPHDASERPRQGTEPRTDLDHEIRGTRRDRINDLRNQPIVDEEVLAEALPRPMRHALGNLWFLGELRRKRKSGKEAARISSAASCEIERRPVIH